jgi:hypothetical protein
MRKAIALALFLMLAPACGKSGGFRIIDAGTLDDSGADAGSSENG